MTTFVAGIDGTRHGWLAAFWSGKGSLIECRPLSTIAEIDTWPERPEVVAIDMPIGFPDVASRGGRSCEIEVRQLIGPRRSSVFSSPSRQSLTATSYEAAVSLNKPSRPDGVGLSKQSFALFPKLREVDEFINPAKQDWIIEVHPEFSFFLMNDKRHLGFSKKKREGQEERIRLLHRVGFVGVSNALSMKRDLGAAADDIWDACAVAWTASRVVEHEAIRLPNDPPLDGRGLRMEIWG